MSNSNLCRLRNFGRNELLSRYLKVENNKIRIVYNKSNKNRFVVISALTFLVDVPVNAMTGVWKKMRNSDNCWYSCLKLSPHSEIQCVSSITSNFMRVCHVLDKNTFFQWGFNKRKLKSKYTFNMKNLYNDRIHPNPLSAHLWLRKIQEIVLDKCF